MLQLGLLTDPGWLIGAGCGTLTERAQAPRLTSILHLTPGNSSLSFVLSFRISRYCDGSSCGSKFTVAFVSMLANPTSDDTGYVGRN